MRRILRCGPVALLLGFVMTVPAGAADLELKRVMLSSGGVGYFEYEAKVEGDAELVLDVPLDQVDDVLKSLVVYAEGGTAGEITLPGRQPLTQSFADLPFDRAALGSAADLLNALQGAEIRVAGPRPLTGRLVHVDQETGRGAGGLVETRERVTVLTAAGLQQVLLQDVEGIAFVDPVLAGQVATALRRLADYRAPGRRRLSLTTRGKGSRTVRVGYVVAMPLWKASYRLSLPADPEAATARLQGWAVLENFSGQTWHDVELTLLSGNPVTFRQALYESYYVPRPTVPVEAGGHVLPPPDTGAVAGAATAKASPARRPSSRAALAAPAASPPPPPEESSEPAAIEAAAAAQSATEIAFTLPYKVSVAVGQSLVVPLLDRQLPARRIDLYQPRVDDRHPLAAIDLTNDGDTGLPPGVLTLYQQRATDGALYLGDARLAAFPAGEKRLVSYAVDSTVTVDLGEAERRFVVKAAIAEGVLRLNRLVRQTTTYRVKTGAAAPGLPSQLLIEHPRRFGWTLTAPDPHSVELSAGSYRIPAALAGKKEGVVTVIEDQPLEEAIGLADLEDDRLGVLVASQELDPKIRQALADLAARRQAVSRQRAELERLKEERAELVADETRLRADLAALPNEPALRKRLLDRFTETETAIDRVSAAMAKAAAALAAAHRDLTAFVNGLSL